jgi:hypothetical protein
MLTLSAPKRFSVDRPESAREMLLTARRAWKYVLEHFDDVRLDAKEGNFFDALEDYGSFKAKLSFHRTMPKHGVAFLGTPFYDKSGRSKERASKATFPHSGSNPALSAPDLVVRSILA